MCMMEYLYKYILSSFVLAVGISANTIERNRPQNPAAGAANGPVYGDVRVIIKRDADDQQAQLPSVDGRTFRASEPLDPNAGTHQQLVDDSFHTSHVIFEPAVEEADDTSGHPVAASTRHVAAENDRGRQRSAAMNAYETTADRHVEEDADAQTLHQQQARHSARSSNDRAYTPGNVRRPGYTSGGDEDAVSSPTGSGGLAQESDRRTHTAHETRTADGSPSDGGPIDSSYLSGASYPIGSEADPGAGSVTDVRGGDQDTPGTAGHTGTRGYYDSSGQFVFTGQTYHDPSGGRQYAGNTAGSRYHGQGHRYDASGRNYDTQQRYYDSSGSYRGADVRGRDVDTDAGVASSPDDGAGSQQYIDTLSGRYVNYGTQRSAITSQISSELVCRPTNTHVTINGLSCTEAISRVGAFVCYNYERVSDDCCETCLQVKSPENTGCEYGDRSFQCRNIQPFDCYAERNRRICCQRCRQFQEQSRSPGGICVFGDYTPRCQSIRQRPYLCYLPENKRLCCETCPRLAHNSQPDCRWGNQNPELCQPFDDDHRVKINCYLPAVQQVCCATCRGLRERMQEDVRDCEYGDSPVQFSTARGVLDCGQYLREYGVDNCDHPEVAQKCCYTCYGYRAARRG